MTVGTDCDKRREKRSERDTQKHFLKRTETNIANKIYVGDTSD